MNAAICSVYATGREQTTRFASHRGLAKACCNMQCLCNRKRTNNQICARDQEGLLTRQVSTRSLTSKSAVHIQISRGEKKEKNLHSMFLQWKTTKVLTHSDFLKPTTLQDCKTERLAETRLLM